MSERIHIDENDGIATVSMTRGEKRNALDLEMIEALVEAGEALKSRKDIRAVTLQGEGAAFSAGLDTSAFPLLLRAAEQSGGITGRSHGESNLFQRAAMVWTEVPVPVIAALHGFAFGGAFQIALAADIRISAPDCRFSIMEGKWGIVPDMGGMVLMPGLAHSDVIRRLTYTAEIFDARAACDWGFVTELADDPKERALALAREIAARSPDAVRAAKAMISQTERMNSAADILMQESVVQQSLIGTPNQLEAVMAGLQQRPPVFRDPK